MIPLLPSPSSSLCLPQTDHSPALHHIFEQEDIDAVNAAMATGRPLLIKGEPGVGKSQLARAVACEEALNFAYIQMVVTSQTESSDLLWSFDAVARLAEAQVSGSTTNIPKNNPTAAHKAITDSLRIERFVRPGPLWWAFDWASAQDQATLSKSMSPPQANSHAHKKGCVVLIDEIDKAEPEVPNGLLEALGNNAFAPYGSQELIRASKETQRLIIITTNEERALPDAFIRRCLVLHKRLPTDDDELVRYLTKRAVCHFGDEEHQADFYEEAAKQTVEDRNTAKEQHLRPLPGQAEYLDLIKACLEMSPALNKSPSQILETISHLALKKNRGPE